MQKILFQLKNADIAIHGKKILTNVSWKFCDNENWAILGPNGSGKSTLVRALWGESNIIKGFIGRNFMHQTHKDSFTDDLSKYFGYVSFELHQKIIENDEFQDFVRGYAGKRDEYTSTFEVILSGIAQYQKISKKEERAAEQIAQKLGIKKKLMNDIKVISSGEMRKTLIARALMKEPKILILDEPFDGLDKKSSVDLAAIIERLAHTNTCHIILITHNFEEITKSISHVLLLCNGKIFIKGKRENVLKKENIQKILSAESKNITPSKKTVQNTIHYQKISSSREKHLIEMENVTVEYEKKTILKNFNWTVHDSENWLILGPNGSGKSTIVRLIHGDNLQVYANKIRILGMKLGTNATLWQIREKIGFISSDLQVQYRKKMTAKEVILSGFYHSIGLHCRYTQEQAQIADYWINAFHIADLSKKNFMDLSYGQKRMILLARAMVKNPAILLLDEPTHGLDITNRKRFFDVLKKVDKTRTNIIMTTHREDEKLSLFQNVLELEIDES